jgi:5-methylcytosine-specific restriction endonuclease McrA
MEVSPELKRKARNTFRWQQKRAKQAGRELDYTEEDLLRSLIGDLSCPYCGAALTINNVECDHKRPICRGESFNEWNLEWLCRECNKAKGPLTDFEFERLWEALQDLEDKARQNVLTRLRVGGRIERRF